MPTNANTFNSRITSEALEKKFRDVFPAQGGAELIQDLYAAGTIQPVIDFSTVAEGSVLPQNLQTSWDFSTSIARANNTTAVAINNPGFWLVQINYSARTDTTDTKIDAFLSDGLTTKVIFEQNFDAAAADNFIDGESVTFIVFLRAGDSLSIRTDDAKLFANIISRQIADVNGNLVNPLGFTFS